MCHFFFHLFIREKGAAGVLVRALYADAGGCPTRTLEYTINLRYALQMRLIRRSAADALRRFQCFFPGVRSVFVFTQKQSHIHVKCRYYNYIYRHGIQYL